MRLRLRPDDGTALPDGAVSGPARVDRRTKNLTKRLKPGDIAVIDHLDLDRVSAEALVACRPAAVVNASRSISGRYPNLGPDILVAGGIPLVDDAGPAVMSALRDGQPLVLHEGEIRLGRDVVAVGTVQTPESIEESLTQARAGLSDEIEAFAANTMEFLRQERELLLDGVGVPDIRTELDGRHVLIVVRGYHYKEDLAHLSHYIREYRPVLIGVDGGADALIEARLKPDLIVGDMDSVSDAALTCGAEIVVHAYRDGRAPGQQRVVAVGTHVTLVEFLDKGRSGMASTFLTRLRVGGKLVDAKGVNRLYRSRISTLSLVVMLGIALLALGAALWSTAGGQALIQVGWARLDDLWSAVKGVFT